MLGAPYRDLSVVHDLRLEQVIDRFVESRFHFAAGGVVDDIRIKWTRLVGDVHHRDHRSNHGVVVQRNLVGIVATFGPNLWESAFGALHGQKKIDGFIETCLKCGFVIVVRRFFVTHGKEAHFLDGSVVVYSAEVATAFSLPFGFLAAGIGVFVLARHRLVKTAVCDLPCGHVVGVPVNVHARCSRSQLRVAAIAVDFRNRCRGRSISGRKRKRRDRHCRYKKLVVTKPKILHKRPIEEFLNPHHFYNLHYNRPIFVMNFF